MLRSALLYLSDQKGLQNFILRSKLARGMSHRFVAGETLDEAIEVTRDLNARGMDVTLDHLGEAVEREGQASRATDDLYELRYSPQPATSSQIDKLRSRWVHLCKRI